MKALRADASGSTNVYKKTQARTLTQHLFQGTPGTHGGVSSPTRGETGDLKKQLEEAGRRESLLLLRVEELEREAELARLEMEPENLKALDAQRQMYETQLDSQREEARLEEGLTLGSRGSQNSQGSDRRLKYLEEEVDLIKQGIPVSNDDMVYQYHTD